MAQTVIGWLVAGAVWVLQRWSPEMLARVVPADPAMANAQRLITLAMSTAHTGAWKAAQVKIALYKLYPQRRRRELNLLVEQLVQGV